MINITNRTAVLSAGFVALLIAGLFVWATAAGASASPTDLSQSTKTVNYPEQKAGELVEFTITVRQTGSDSAVVLTDTLPAGLSFVADSIVIPDTFTGAATNDWRIDGQQLMWNGTMLNNSEVVLSYQAMVSETAIVGSILTNTVEISAEDGAAVTVSAGVLVRDKKAGATDVYLPMLSYPGIPGLCYQPSDNGVIMMDATRENLNGWEYVVSSDTVEPGFFRWPAGHDSIINPGEGILTYLVDIQSPGTYFMRIRTLARHPHSPTEANDIWTRVDNAFWQKTISWGYQWKQWGWATGREIHGGDTQDPPYFNFTTTGIHKIEVSARSGQFGMERIALYKSGAFGFNEPINYETNRSTVDSALDTMAVSAICDDYYAPNVNH